MSGTSVVSGRLSRAFCFVVFSIAALAAAVRPACAQAGLPVRETIHHGRLDRADRSVGAGPPSGLGQPVDLLSGNLQVVQSASRSDPLPDCGSSGMSLANNNGSALSALPNCLPVLSDKRVEEIVRPGVEGGLHACDLEPGENAHMPPAGGSTPPDMNVPCGNTQPPPDPETITVAARSTLGAVPTPERGALEP